CVQRGACHRAEELRIILEMMGSRSRVIVSLGDRAGTAPKPAHGTISREPTKAAQRPQDESMTGPPRLNETSAANATQPTPRNPPAAVISTRRPTAATKVARLIRSIRRTRLQHRLPYDFDGSSPPGQTHKKTGARQKLSRSAVAGNPSQGRPAF